MIEIASKEKLYIDYLREIGGINLTMREMDVVSCILYNRGEKKIGELLVISYRTVSTHVRNVMAKLACHSRDQIIDKVERSGKLQYIKQYYYHLLLQGNFIKHLHQIGAVANRLGMSYLVNAENISLEEQNLLKYIKLYLGIANIHLVENVESNSTQLHIANSSLSKIEYEENISNDIQKNIGTNKGKNIVLLLDNKIDSQILDGIEYIDFAHSKNHYLTLLLLLKKLISQPIIDEIIEAFKIKQLALENSFTRNDVVKHNKRICSKISARLLVTIFILCTSSAIILWFFIKNQEFTNKSEVVVETKSKNWNLPPLIEHYTRRQALTDAIWNRFENKKTTGNIAVLAGLHGLGGIGKTTLAKNAIHNSEKAYNIKAWFRAESKNLLQTDYLAFGDYYNLLVQNNLPVERKIALVKAWLEQQESILLVYDNVEDMDMLKDYLPNKGDIIVTSRNHNIPGAIEIDVMSEEEAENLLNNLLPHALKQQKNSKKEIENLSRTLGYLPLAISQAGAYISENDLTIEDYLSLYSTEQSKLLSDKTMPPMDNHLPVYVSWDVNIKKLKEHKNGDQVLELLNLMSCCYPEHIPKKLLAQYLYNNTDNKAMVELNKLLTLLRKYSMIKTTTDSISLHRLVHGWLEYRVHNNLSNFKNIDSDTNFTKKLYKKLCKSLNLLMPKVNAEFRDNWSVAKLLYPHIDRVLKMNLSQNKDILYEKAKLWNKVGLYYRYIVYQVYKALSHYREAEIIYNKLSIRNDNLAETLINQGWCFFSLTKLDEALDCFERALKLLNASKSTEILAGGLTGKGFVYDQMKGRELEVDPLQCLLEAYEIYQKLYLNQDHPMLARAMHNIAWHYKDNGKRFEPDKAFEWFNKSFAMRKRLYKNELHEDIAASLNSMGDLYRRLGGEANLKKALEYQLESLEIREKLYVDHISQYLINSYARLEETYSDLRNYEKATDFAERMLEGTNKLYSYNHKHIKCAYLRLAEIHEKLGNITMAVEYYKKSYIVILRNNYNLNHPKNKQILSSLKRLAPEFIKNPETRIFITQRSVFNKERYNIQAKLQSKILDKLHEAGKKGIWPNGLEEDWFKFSQAEGGPRYRSYVSTINIIKAYEDKMTDEQLLIALELCFKAINFGIMLQAVKPGEKRDLTCFIEFVKENPGLVNKIAKDHPEYFVDGSLLIEAVKIGVITEDQAKKAIGEEEYRDALK